MNPKQFIEKWHGNPLNERQSYQAHFRDLCALLSVPEPFPATADTYCFERGVTKTGSNKGWADVWKKGYFAFEYKAPGGDLGKALKQLMLYALALDNPPLLVVCDTDKIEIHTHFTNAPSERHIIKLEKIGEPENLDKLRWLFTDPDKFHPKRTITQITEAAAGKFAALAQSLNGRGHDPQAVAHFLNQCLFCLFAEDAELLPGKLFERLLEKSQTDPAKLSTRLDLLFTSMRRGGDFGADDIAWFNGGLFEKIEVLPLHIVEIKILHEAAKLNWSSIEPSIFGTLFERGLDPKKRSQLGANYTDAATILRIINPVVVEPLAKEWETIKQKISDLHPKLALIGKKRNTQNEAMKEGYRLFHSYLERLKNFRVLDPACGSGNFLYLVLRALKDLEHRANLDAETLGLLRQVSIECSPANVLGIELNPYAAELARVTVWIGEIQWMIKNGYPFHQNPILHPLDQIENRDALLNDDGSEAQWPTADVVIGNPPFLGGSRMRRELGDDYTEVLRMRYEKRVPGGADLVCYWFQKAQEKIEKRHCYRAGLVATNSIRQPTNRRVLDRIVKKGRIFEAWSDEPWINNGAAVRVSLVCFEGEINSMSPTPVFSNIAIKLDGCSVTQIHANLRSGDDLTMATPLPENRDVSFFGLELAGSFSIKQDQAMKWLSTPNPNGRPSSDVVRPLWNGQDLTGRWDGRWVVDFGPTMSENDTMLYEAPFQYILRSVKPTRISNKRKSRADTWWRHGEARPAMRKALAGLGRYIATSEKSKHRFFIWLDERIAPDKRLVVIARNDDATFGILSSRIHVCWALAVGSTLEDRPAYATTTCFETFPFPEGLTPNLLPTNHTNNTAAEIAIAAKELNKLRKVWLNPPEWTDWVHTPEEKKAGCPARPVAKPGCETDLKKRTLTNLYNKCPEWLENSHRTLDKAVAKAYGWDDYTAEMSDKEILSRLLALNHARA